MPTATGSSTCVDFFLATVYFVNSERSDCPTCGEKGWSEMKVRLLALLAALGIVAAFLGDGIPWPH
jgi:hypothetical protein